MAPLALNRPGGGARGRAPRPVPPVLGRQFGGLAPAPPRAADRARRHRRCCNRRRAGRRSRRQTGSGSASKASRNAAAAAAAAAARLLGAPDAPTHRPATSRCRRSAVRRPRSRRLAPPGAETAAVNAVPALSQILDRGGDARRICRLDCGRESRHRRGRRRRPQAAERHFCGTVARPAERRRAEACRAPPRCRRRVRSAASRGQRPLARSRGPRAQPQRGEHRRGEEANSGSELDHDVPPLDAARSISVARLAV